MEIKHNNEQIYLNAQGIASRGKGRNEKKEKTEEKTKGNKISVFNAKKAVLHLDQFMHVLLCS